jgi:SPP1 gp7 family putative phage head morphogenesis protein
VSIAEEALYLIDRLLRGGAEPEVLERLLDLEDAIANRLRRIAGVIGLTATKLRDMLTASKRMIEQTYTAIADSLETNLSATIPVVFSEAELPVAKQMIRELAANTLIENRTAAEWWRGQSEDLQQRFATQMRLGMVANENLEELMKRVRGTSANNFKDGIMSLSRAQAETLVRTSIVNTANQARLVTYSQQRDIIDGIQWVTARDDRVDDPCLELSGKKWSIPANPEHYGAYKPIGHGMKFPGPTEHWNCRCVQVPVMKPLTEL